MPEFFLELFSEEIPARMQPGGAAELWHRVAATHLEMKDVVVYSAPRRIALSATIAPNKPGEILVARGPRQGAPEAAVQGFLNKHLAENKDLALENGYFVLRKNLPEVSASEVLRTNLPGLLSYMAWPKSMRWGQSGNFTWVRPLRRIVCLLDREVIPFSLGPVTSSNETEGHRFLGPGPFKVSSKEDWLSKLKEHYVIAYRESRRDLIFTEMEEKASALGLRVLEDDGLLEEVTGLVEWPVPLIGSIDENFMDLPPEVRELSMKVNQKYFALRHHDGTPAPHFAFVSNMKALDGGHAIIAGNERVLRARLSDARHFWDTDLKKSLGELLPKLEAITFHAKIGTQRQRVDRIAHLARRIADILGADGPESDQAYTAGLLSKADLVTGMVGEFPELQGIMGGYYAEQSLRNWVGLDEVAVGAAIKTHYLPRGPRDPVPSGIVAVSVALADKLDTLVKFFEAGEKPTGSGDPYALRRAALGVIRIILENNLRIHLLPLVNENLEVFSFLIERLRVKFRTDGRRYDVLDAVMSAASDDDLVRITKRVDAISVFLFGEDGPNFLSAYRRAANILSIEEANDATTYHQTVNESDFTHPADKSLSRACRTLWMELSSPDGLIQQEKFTEAMFVVAAVRPQIDAFFQEVAVNDNNPDLRRNRLRLLSEFCDRVNEIADFSKIEG